MIVKGSKVCKLYNFLPWSRARRFQIKSLAISVTFSNGSSINRHIVGYSQKSPNSFWFLIKLVSQNVNSVMDKNSSVIPQWFHPEMEKARRVKHKSRLPKTKGLWLKKLDQICHLKGNKLGSSWITRISVPLITNAN